MPPAAEAKAGGALVDADQASPDQCLQGARRRAGALRLGKREFSSAGGQFGEDCLLFGGERGQALLGNEHRESIHAAGVVLHGGGFAGNPLFAHEGG